MFSAETPVIGGAVTQAIGNLFVVILVWSAEHTCLLSTWGDLLAQPLILCSLS